MRHDNDSFSMSSQNNVFQNLGATEARFQMKAEQSSDTKLGPYVKLLDSLRKK